MNTLLLITLLISVPLAVPFGLIWNRLFEWAYSEPRNLTNDNDSSWNYVDYTVSLLWNLGGAIIGGGMAYTVMNILSGLGVK